MSHNNKFKLAFKIFKKKQLKIFKMTQRVLYTFKNKLKFW